MLDEEFLLSLPDNNEDAFPIYEAYVRKHSWEIDYQGNEYFNLQDYLRHMRAFIAVHELDFVIPRNISHDEEESIIRSYSVMLTLKGVKIKKANSSPVYVLSSAIKKEIHHYIQLIRDKVECADLIVDKKERLLNRLNKFAIEVDKDRTDGKALGDTYLYAMKTVGEGIKGLEPVVGYVERIFKAMSKADEYQFMLPSPKELKKLTGPVKKEDFEDEIPF